MRDFKWYQLWMSNNFGHMKSRDELLDELDASEDFPDNMDEAMAFEEALEEAIDLWLLRYGL